MPNPKATRDGYSKTPVLTEGYIRKGGSNSAVSQIQTRPDPPAPMQPASPPLGVDVRPQGGVTAPKK